MERWRGFIKDILKHRHHYSPSPQLSSQSFLFIGKVSEQFKGITMSDEVFLLIESDSEFRTRLENVTIVVATFV
jgi:hypothetical protein